MNDTVLPFPAPDEERARRLRVEVERLARLPTVEWMLYVATESHAAKYGVDCATLKRMVEVVVKENEKKRRAEQVEQRQIEARAERKQEREDQRVRRDRKEEVVLSRKEIERERKEAERARKEAERTEREQEAKRVKREAAFAEIAELPKLTHEVRLKEAAKRLGEDFDFLVGEFEVYFAAREVTADLTPWPDPVNTAELLAEIEAKFRRYVVAPGAIVTASVLYPPFTYVAEVATHAPKLVYTFPERDAGKSTALHTERWMVLRGYPAIEATGAVVYRIMDRLRPTLCLDEADSLFKRRTALAHIINESWSNSGTKIPRTGSHGEILEFDPYGPQIIAMKGLSHMKDTTQSRCIVCMIGRSSQASEWTRSLIGTTTSSRLSGASSRAGPSITRWPCATPSPCSRPASTTASATIGGCCWRSLIWPAGSGRSGRAMLRWNWRPAATSRARRSGCSRHCGVSGAGRRSGPLRAFAQRSRSTRRSGRTSAARGQSVRSNSPRCCGRSGSGRCTTCVRAGGRGTGIRAVIDAHSSKTRGRGCCKNRRETRSLAHPGQGGRCERVSESPVEFSRW